LQEEARNVGIDDTLRSLLHENRYEDAFAHVLGLRNEVLLSYVCSQVPRSQYFETQGLRQNVLLSLIQQLSRCDLRQHTNLKAGWLRDAMLALDTAPSHVHPFISDVLSVLSEVIGEMPAEVDVSELRLCAKIASSILR